MLKYFVLIISSVSLIFLSSCKKSPVDPEEIKPGRRDYQWIADTLYNTPWNSISGIWGASENDIWAIAHAGELSKALWHYDGSKWTNIHIQKFEPCSIYGFSTKEIWAGGYWGEFWKYNGTTWTKVSEYKIENTSAFGIQRMFGTSPNDIYGVGTAFPVTGPNTIPGRDNMPVLMHYNGVTWSFVKTPDVNGNLQDIIKDPGGKGHYLIHAYNPSQINPDSARVFSFDGTTYRQLYGGVSDREGWVDLAVMGNHAYVSIGRKIYRYQDDQLVLVKDFSSTNYLGRIWGRSEKDFFCLAEDGIAHYDGNDLKTVYKNFVPGNAIVFQNQVFFYTYDENTNNNIILKGILK